MMMYDAIVIGAGQAGLAAGYHLQKAGLTFRILEASDEPAGSWPHYYDSLTLNSPARYSSLPGLPFPGQPDRYPARDEVVAYLRRYAAHFGLPIRFRTRVSSVERTDHFFRVMTNDAGYYVARTVVAATGFFGRPHLPDLPGQPHFRGRVLHVANYRRPEPFRGQRIVVVGGGNAAVQIGIELAEVAEVTLATRRPIRYLPQRLLGRDIHFWFHLTGLDRTQWLNGETTPVYATEAITTSRLLRKPMFRHFTEDGVVWSDGRQEAVDTVIFATGYRPALDYLRGLGALDEAGDVLQRSGLSTSVPGLGYVGLARQRNLASATLRGVGPDAKMVVDRLRQYCQGQKRRSTAPPALWPRRSMRTQPKRLLSVERRHV
jgi:putative flavoprotein involved in K+ transport